MLISGAGAGVDVEDMRANVQYAGGYHEDHPVVHEFWKVRPGAARDVHEDTTERRTLHQCWVVYYNGVEDIHQGTHNLIRCSATLWWGLARNRTSIWVEAFLVL